MKNQMKNLKNRPVHPSWKVSRRTKLPRKSRLHHTKIRKKTSNKWKFKFQRLFMSQMATELKLSIARKPLASWAATHYSLIVLLHNSRRLAKRKWKELKIQRHALKSQGWDSKTSSNWPVPKEIETWKTIMKKLNAINVRKRNVQKKLSARKSRWNKTYKFKWPRTKQWKT